MPVGSKRNRVLYGLLAKRGSVHRYTLWRWGIGSTLTVAVALLPFTGVLRFDFWGGSHMWLGERVGLVEAAKAFVFPFLGINIAIVLASRFLGRWLCGFVCPIGNLNRLSEWSTWGFRSAWPGRMVMFAASLLLAAITFSFWVDWAVFVRGSASAATVAAAFLFATTAVIYGCTRFLGMRFCREFCPSGVYFALLGPQTRTGVDFAHPDHCTDCHACESVCPVDLEPRKMASETARSGMGFYPDGLTNYANCLRCGDCVAACEGTTARQDGSTPLRLGVLPSAAAREDVSLP